MENRKFDPDKFEVCEVTLNPQCFKTTEHYDAVKLKFLNISPKLKGDERVINDKELFIVTLDPRSVDSEEEYLRIRDELRKLINEEQKSQQ